MSLINKEDLDKHINPDYYKTGKIEVVDFIEDKELDWHLGNATKYLVRAGKKDPSMIIVDLEKAIWYIKRKIELINKDLSSTEKDIKSFKDIEESIRKI